MAGPVRRGVSYVLAALALLLPAAAATAGIAAAGEPGAADGAIAAGATSAVSAHTLAAAIAAPTDPAEPIEPAPVVPVTADDADRVLSPPLVVLGVGGLGWDEISPALTPTLWSLLDDGAAAAAVTVHTSGQPACPAGGWLSLSAGRAAISDRFGGWCLSLPEITQEGSAGGEAAVAQWPVLAEEQSMSTYSPAIGTLGSTLTDAGVCATAVGPGAALALAEDDGRIARYFPTVSPAVFDCPVTLIDLGVTSVLDRLGGGPLPVDARIADVLSVVPDGSTVLVTSVATTVGARLAMGVALATGPGVAADLMSTPSTRRDGVVRLLDLPSTLVDAVGVDEPADFQGAPLLLAGARDDAATTVRDLADITVADRGLRAAATPLLNTLGVASLVLVVGTLLLARRRDRAAGTRLRTAVELAFLVLAAAPLASYLVTLLHWWRFSDPGVALWAGMTAIAVLLGLGVHVLPRRPLWQVALGLSLLTSAVLVIDAVTGATLHWGSPLGTSPVLGNRYYGYGNSTYAVFAVHTIVLAGALAGHYVAASRRKAAVAAVVVVAVIAVVVDIWPTWGADVGGGLALVPAFGVLALGVGGRRLTATRAMGALGGGVLVVAVVAWLDWLRPAADRSHAGRFVQQVLDGDATDLLGRKLDYAVASLNRGLPAWLTLLALAAATAVVVKPGRFSPPSLNAAAAYWPGLRATLAALLVSAVLGSLVNDWGIRVATVLLTAALPLMAVVCLRAVGTLPVVAQRPSPDRTVDRSATSATAPNTASAITPEAAPPASAPANPAVSNRTPTR